jgi:outer membrane protein assembly factor BamB
VTPTAGGLVFFGDIGGNFYALETATGQKLWGQKIGGAIGGGVITYTVNGARGDRLRISRRARRNPEGEDRDPGP